MAGTEENSEPLKYRTWILKVSIHCEGCKRKVKKVLQSIEGVYTTDVDSQQHKVTVTGDVGSETLIKKLAKTGKHAELWPEQVEKKGKKSGKSKNNEKQKDPESIDNGNGNPNSNEPKAKSKSPKNGENGGSEEVAKNGNEEQSKESKSDGKKPETSSADNQSPATMDKQGTESDEATTEKESSGTSGKKKKKKGQKVNITEDGEPAGESPAIMRSPVVAGPASMTYPHPNLLYPYPPYGPRTVTPVYGYNTAHPSSSYSTVYYPAPPPQPYTYGVYSNQGSYSVSPPKYDSFEMLNDENANSCLIM